MTTAEFGATQRLFLPRLAVPVLPNKSLSFNELKPPVICCRGNPNSIPGLSWGGVVGGEDPTSLRALGNLRDL